MDNDPKHYNELALGVFAANEIELLATKRSKADGTHPDVARGNAQLRRAPWVLRRAWRRQRYARFCRLLVSAPNTFPRCRSRCIAETAGIRRRTACEPSAKRLWRRAHRRHLVGVAQIYC
ncbi:hypothetical protein NFJ02_21g45750 [Pycnococcus provasolii]